MSVTTSSFSPSSDVPAWRANPVSEHNTLWTIESKHYIAEVSEYGAHLVRFYCKNRQREILFVSPKVNKSGTSPIRAGVPICWPWFSDMPPPATYISQEKPPSHGFARSNRWRVQHQHIEDQVASIEFSLPADIIAKNLNARVTVTVRYTLSPQRIKIDLITHNHQLPEFAFTQALHTYFAVDAIQQTQVVGLKDDYLDKTRDFNRYAADESVTFTSEVDRVYLSKSEKTNLVEDEKLVEIHHGEHDSIVVWNPWQENCAKIADMADDSYQHFVCVETANTQEKVTLKPGQQSHLQQIIAIVK
jgi:glucose-6-phosphate 1-epimerase